MAVAAGDTTRFALFNTWALVAQSPRVQEAIFREQQQVGWVLLNLCRARVGDPCAPEHTHAQILCVCVCVYVYATLARLLAYAGARHPAVATARPGPKRGIT